MVLCEKIKASGSCLRRRRSEKVMKKVMTHMIRRIFSRKRLAVYAMTMVMLLGFGITAMANESPDRDFGTDSSHILLSEPDTSIEDIDDLVMGYDPAGVLGDSTLKGFSTLAVFSVTAVDDYDFSTLEITKIRGAVITSDMTVQVRFLPTDGAWEKLSFEVVDGAVNVKLPSEGQLAIFVKDEVDIKDDDGDGNSMTKPTTESGTDGNVDPGKAPQTGDRLPFYIVIGVMAIISAVVSFKKIRK